jgi:hypothetical protein
MKNLDPSFTIDPLIKVRIHHEENSVHYLSAPCFFSRWLRKVIGAARHQPEELREQPQITRQFGGTNKS